jgi:hypothetical protein
MSVRVFLQSLVGLSRLLYFVFLESFIIFSIIGLNIKQNLINH